MSQLPWHVDAAEFEKFANDGEVENQAELVQANAKPLRGLTALHTAVSCHTSPLANLRSHAH